MPSTSCRARRSCETGERGAGRNACKEAAALVKAIVWPASGRSEGERSASRGHRRAHRWLWPPSHWDVPLASRGAPVALRAACSAACPGEGMVCAGEKGGDALGWLRGLLPGAADQLQQDDCGSCAPPEGGGSCDDVKPRAGLDHLERLVGAGGGRVAM
uniref:Uncharacterized protein n=1 Tax=Tetraselmis sp. GSL018 TaxID=582737 RepID=A0A061SGR6_9CHLO|eukprot:CAMPEP_0177583324 /NCGR_PEP_ID=MMETSP0419_2-20121207/3256_1 /TAXON_ID=582737 /ORGANISM="Tetraselmis sp., Strain GSL018" /LENGTH=158 /DNA_ID=CAMNT_0019072697 /DNA_START=127 /DNA_END=603 /DNA_ORIENTATION=-